MRNCISIRIIIICISILLFVLMTATSIYNFHKIEKYHTTRVELYKLRTAILYANLGIRDAAITPSVEIRENELYKMQGTRKIASAVFTHLSSERLSPESFYLYKQIRNERAVYRKAQNNVVAIIRNQESYKDEYNHVIWQAMIPYSTLMFNYINQVDELIVLSHNSSNVYKKISKQITFLTLSFSILILIVFIKKI